MLYSKQTNQLTSFDGHEYPRVLVIDHHPLTRQCVAGSVWCNLFQNWPTGTVSCVTSSSMSPAPGFAIPTWTVGQGRDVHQGASRSTRSSRASRIRAAAARLCPTAVREWYGEKRARRHSVPSESLLTWVTENRPQVGVSMLGSARMVCLVNQVSFRLNLPVIPYFQDDWPETLYARSIVTRRLRAQLQRELSTAIRRAGLAFVVCDAMAREYGDRYGVATEVIPNCVDSGEQAAVAEVPQFSVSRPLRIVFAGNLYLGRPALAIDVAQAVEQLVVGGARVEFRLYLGADDRQKYGPLLARYAGTRLFDWVEPELLSATLRECDIGLHIDDFSPSARSLIQFSFGAKIPEYLMASLPILSYAPSSYAVASMIRDRVLGVVVSERKIALVRAAISQLLADRQRLVELKRRAREEALGRFEPTMVRSRLRQALLRASLGETRGFKSVFWKAKYAAD